MFGDVLRNDKSFDTCMFGDYVEQMNIGPFGSALKNSCFVTSDQAYCMVYEQKHAIKKDAFLEPRFINIDKYRELKRFEVCAGDIIVSCRGTIGECYLLPKGAPNGIIHPSLMMIKPKASVNNSFLVFLLRSILAEQNTEGAGVKMAIKATELSKISTILPPRDVQDEFILFTERIDKSKFIVHSRYFLCDILTFESSTIAYPNVVSILECPSKCCTCSIGMPLSIALVASVLLNLCG